jgi:ABC-type multidrug transport system ATPase subunit/ABC-type multidrug transport system permease subunit
MFLSMGQAAQVATFMDERAVFYKQRGANFFRSVTYVLASSLTQIPFALVETVIFGLCVYWMGGYVDDFGRFLVFLLTLFLCQMFFLSYFFFISSAMPNLTIAQPIMIVSIVFFVLFGGFLIAKDDIADYFIWVYWINPLSWCIQALSINEYMAPKFKVCVYKDVDYCDTYNVTMGEYSLSLFNLPSDTAWIYYAWIYFAAGYVVLVLSSYFALEFKRYESPENVSAFDEKLDLDSDAQDGYMAMPTTPKAHDAGIVGPTIAVPVQSETRREIVPVTLAFEDLWYSVPMPGSHDHEEIDLLKGISGFALPGTMTALMGSSGAGKTTLMDVIAGRKTGGKIKGKILLNGHPANDLAISRCTGYCEQMDIHSDSATIREALTFSALLRQDASVSYDDKLASVEDCIELLELGSIADQIIRGSSSEQMKRLTIGVELAADPSILFMDEPTSGLDARSAKLIMDGVRKIANTGRTVICTIHQPSYEVFTLFDSLLVLQRGGRMVYFGQLGEHSSKLIEYFQAIPEVKPIQPGYNPATWMLECIGAGVGNDIVSDFADIFQSSDLKHLMEENLDQDGVTRPSKFLPEIVYTTKRAAISQVQFYLLLQRFFRMYWRTPSYNLTRLLITIMLAALYAVIYQGTDFTTYTGVNTGVGMVFTSTAFLGMVGFNSVMPVAAEERTAFYRERASQTYNALWYFIAGTIAEIPYVVLSALIFSIIIFPSVGFTGYSTFFMYWLVATLNLLLYVYFGQMLIFALPSIEVAQVIGMLLVSIFMLFAGFNPPTNSIPDAYIWIHYISPPTYSIAIFSAIIFADCPGAGSSNFGCLTMAQAPPSIGSMTIKVYVERTFSMNYDDIARNLVVICCLIVAFRLLALVSLRYVNHQVR